MTTNEGLTRFITAQEHVYEKALAEIRRGRKSTHWMWFIFPQIAGLGFSEMNKLYALKNKEEAEAYLRHPILGPRLIEITNALLQSSTNNAVDIFGTVDSMKLQSSMTLFSLVENADPIFEKLLDKFYNGLKDIKTIHLLR